jgi:hypothetical protein
MKLIIAIILEKLHRYVFDNIYIYKRGDFTRIDNLIIAFYRKAIKIHPTFRQQLKLTGKEKYKRYT